MTFALLMTMGTAVGCSEVVPAKDDGTGGTPVTTVGCTNNLAPEISILDWQLMVVPNTIESGESFSASLDGVAVFSESFLDAAQPFVVGGVREGNLVELNGAVQVRSGATGPNVILTVDENLDDYECAEGRTPCDPQNDLEGVPGARANTDCQPQSAANPCGRFILLPTSTDCVPGGVCAARNKTGPQSQCALNGFCITGDLQIPLRADTGQYTAESGGNVLFGWAEGESTGATIRESGPDEGTWILPEAIYEEPTGPLGVRVSIGGLTVALECTMGVDSQGALGVDSLNFLASPTPNSALLSFPIEAAR